MKVVNTIDEVRAEVKAWKREGMKIGLVPTMGYLHEGHQSLMKAAVKDCDKVVVSVFVNPMQFGPGEDLESYPRDMERDTEVCREAGVDLIFHPEPSEMYHEDFSSFVDMNTLTDNLCGKTRPIHFRGVLTVVSKLFHIVMPDKAYFGQKDAQQLAVIRHMVSDMNEDIEIVGCPIIREPDGLAKSSRNTYLSPEERKAALCLSRAVFAGQDMVKKGEKDAIKVRAAMVKIIEEEPLAKIDYVQLVDFKTLTDIDTVCAPMLAAMAVYIGKTRLIDNFIVE